MSNLILKVILFFLCPLILYNINGFYNSERVLIVSLLIMWLSVFAVFKEGKISFSLFKIFYIFSFFFFGLAPYIQFIEGVKYSERTFNENTYFFSLLLIFFIMLIYYFLYNFFYKTELSQNVRKKIVYLNYYGNKFSNRSLIILLLLVSFSFILVFHYNNYNLISMLIRGGETKEIISTSSAYSLIITKFFQPIPVICLLYYLSIPNKNILIFSYLLFSCLFIASPIGMPRFATASLYLPFLILLPYFKKGNSFSLIFIFCFLFLLPFLNNFRHFTPGKHLYIGFDFNMFNTAAFDSFHNFAIIINERIITYGKQLLGVIFFWIPRNVWPNKPIGSGAFLGEKFGFHSTNISANFFAEGYINFGIVGIILFLGIIAWVTAKIDNIYWNYSKFEKHNFFNIIYSISLGLFFFILRGDLLSSFAFTVSFILSALFIFRSIVK